MQIPRFDPGWPDDWQRLYNYDCIQWFRQDGRSSVVVDPGGAPPLSRRDKFRMRRAYQRRFARTIALVRSTLPVGARILDVGAAEGNFTLALASRGYRMTWNDNLAAREEYVRQKITDERIEFAPGNIFTLDVAELFDGVLATEVVEHVAHPDRFIARLAALAKPGGVLVLSTPNGDYLRNRLRRFSDMTPEQLEMIEASQFLPDGDGHIFALHRDEITRIAEDLGLAIERITYDIPPQRLANTPTFDLVPYLPWLNRYLCTDTLFVLRTPPHPQ